MEKISSFNFGALYDTGDGEDVETRLGRLWATAAKMFKPMTQIQHYFHDQEFEPYAMYTPSQAMGHFMKEVKTFVRAKGPVKFFETQLRENDITIGVDKIIINEVEIVPVGGSLVAMSALEITARECSNIVAQYTRVKGDAEKIITEAAEGKDIKKVNMPIIKAAPIRTFLENYNPDVMQARDEMYSKLTHKDNLPHLILCTSLIYRNEKLEPYRLSSPDLVAKYDKEVLKSKKKVADENEKRKKQNKKLPEEDRKSMLLTPAWPKIDKAYTLKTGQFQYIMITSPESIWRFYLTSATVRGGQKKIGALTRGYYRFDISPPLISDIEETTDLIMIVRKFKYDAVTLEIPDVKLAINLVKNGVTVYCPALNPNAQLNKTKVGVYSRGDQKSFIYRASDQEPPTLKKHDVTMPRPVPINGTQATFVMEHIPNAGQPGRWYLPSCRVAQGLCIKTNVNPGKYVDVVTLDKLRNRFCQAIWYRNWFLFTRYTFVSQDAYAYTWFNFSWVMPRIKEDIDEDFFKNGNSVSIGDKNENIHDMALTFTEQDEIPEQEPAGELTEEEEQQMLILARALTIDDLGECITWAKEGNFPTDHMLAALYTAWDQDAFIDTLISIRDGKEGQDEDDKGDQDSDPPDQDEENLTDSSDDEIWGGGEPRVAKPVAQVKKKEEQN